MNMKLSVIGGGGVRSVFLAKSIAGRSESLGINEVVFSDTDARKLEIYGGLAKGAAARLAPGLKFVLTTDKTEAVKGADYVITTIRQGGDMLRVADERAALDLGLLGQETTGAAGFGFAMRSQPALVGYCELALKYAKPEVKIFNFTNPAGLMTQSLSCLGYSNAFGVCDAPSGMLRQFADYLGADVKDLRAECYGLNHLSFFADITLNGQSVMRKLMEDDEAYKHTDLRFFDKSKVLELGEIPNEYLYYYFSPEKAVRNILTSGKTRGETIAEIKHHLPNVKILQYNIDTIHPEHDNGNISKILSKIDIVDATLITTADIKRFDVFSPQKHKVGFIPNAVDKSLETAKVFEKSSLDYDLICAVNPKAIRQFCGKFAKTTEIIEKIAHNTQGLKVLFPQVIGDKLDGANYQATIETSAMGINLSAINEDYLYSSDRMAHLMGNGVLAFVDKASDTVTGTVKLKLYKGNIICQGIDSPNSLHSLDISSFDKEGGYDQHDAQGFVNIYGLSNVIMAKKGGN